MCDIVLGFDNSCRRIHCDVHLLSFSSHNLSHTTNKSPVGAMSLANRSLSITFEPPSFLILCLVSSHHFLSFLSAF